jgi:hypothetical protein
VAIDMPNPPDWTEGKGQLRRLDIPFNAATSLSLGICGVMNLDKPSLIVLDSSRLRKCGNVSEGRSDECQTEQTLF